MTGKDLLVSPAGVAAPPVLLDPLLGAGAGGGTAGGESMRGQCEICGAPIPDLDREAFVAQGYQELTWEGRGPYYFCPAHSLDAILLWIAETLICDRGFLHRMRERQEVRP